MTLGISYGISGCEWLFISIHMFMSLEFYVPFALTLTEIKQIEQSSLESFAIPEQTDLEYLLLQLIKQYRFGYEAG